jgi:hypothetical protein
VSARVLQAGGFASPPPRVDERLPWGTAMLAAALVVIVRPAAWPTALAGFLARGGIFVLAVPVVVLPTPTGISNVLAAPLTSVLFGAPSRALISLVAGSVLITVAVLVAGALVGAWAERSGIATALEVAGEEGLVERAGLPAAPDATRRVAALRLLGLLPLFAVLALSAPVLYAGIYHELILPDELQTPLVMRVLRDMPGQLLTIAATWLVADAATALAVRRLVLEHRSIVRAWAMGWAGLIRRPHRVLSTAIAALGVTLLAVVPAVVAAELAWRRTRAVLSGDGSPLELVLSVVLFVAIWLLCLLLAGATSSFRNAAWTYEMARRAGPSSHPR